MKLTEKEKKDKEEWWQRQRVAHAKKYLDTPSEDEIKKIKDIPKGTNPHRKRIMTEGIQKDARKKREDLASKLGYDIPTNDARKRGGK